MEPQEERKITIPEAMRAMSEWVNLKRAGEAKEHIGISAADVDHSSLLYRLLSGKPALEKAPPRRFSYPDYDLGEGKTVRILEIGEWPDETGSGKHICVDQCSEWERTADPMVIRYKESGQLFRLNRPLDELLEERQAKMQPGVQIADMEITLTLVADTSAR